MNSRTMKHARAGYAAGIGLLVALIAIAIGLFLMFGKTPGGGPNGTPGKSYVETVIDAKKSAEETVSHAYLAEIARMVGMYELSNGRYPESMDELARYAGEEGPWMRDPWGQAYTISVDKATKSVRIVSRGPDGQAGTPDDETFNERIPM